LKTSSTSGSVFAEKIPIVAVSFDFYFLDLRIERRSKDEMDGKRRKLLAAGLTIRIIKDGKYSYIYIDMSISAERRLRHFASTYIIVYWSGWPGLDRIGDPKISTTGV